MTGAFRTNGGVRRSEWVRPRKGGRRAFEVGCVVLAAAMGVPAFAQETSPAAPSESTDRAPKIQQLRAVERGWFAQADVGFTVFVNEIDGRRYLPGPQVGLFFGYDVLSILTLGIGASFWAGELSVDGDTPAPRGDLTIVTPGVRVQLAVVTTERNFMWVRADVGFGLGFPAQIDGVDYAGNGPVFGVTAGFERFTKLRHFALGIQGGVVILTQPDIGVGVTITPTVKYTF